MNIKLVRRGSADTVFYLLSSRDDTEEAAAAMTCGASVAAVSVDDWNRDMSPWPAQRCFRGGEDFAGGADEFLTRLIQAVPAFEAEAGLKASHRALCGYSLAGLCALYGAYMSDAFDGAMSASGSMWFDGWIDFMRAHRPANERICVYLSVGDREARTRNMRLASVEECTRAACDILNAAGHRAFFTPESGNHFNEPEKRVARGLDGLFRLYMNEG